VEYNSHNTRRLTVEEIKEKLLTLPFIRQELSQFGYLDEVASAKE
jgi:UDP-glucose 4-epimerase